MSLSSKGEPIGKGHNINKPIEKEEMEEEVIHKMKAMELAKGIAMPMVLKSAIELNILDIISLASDRGSFLSSFEVASQIRGCINPNAPALLDRILSLLTSFSILECKLRKSTSSIVVEKVYGVGPICKYFLSNKIGLDHGEYSLRETILWHYDKLEFNKWANFNEAILEGGIPFNKAYGMPFFEYTKKELRVNKLFNELMSNKTSYLMKKILEIYQGFHGIKTLVDVGGGIGIALSLIISKYPNIEGINFDLSHVLPDDYKKIPGVTYVEGDMFEGVPNGDAILLKCILHDWSDEECLKILKNCWKAVADNGKVIVVEMLLPSAPENDNESQYILQSDVSIFAILGTKERTKQEYEALAIQSGFTTCTVVCSVCNMSVLEFLKV